MTGASFDVAIIGLGAMGGAAAAELARRGQRVIGFDRFDPPHAFGSSHGQTRMIREAYFEDPSYVPLVQRAYTLWSALEQASGQTLFRQTGGLMMGALDGVLVRGVRRSADMHGLPHELLTADQIRQRFPALHPRDDSVAVWEPRAGILFPERCVAAQLTVARAHGALLRLNEPVRAWHADAHSVAISTQRGDYHAHQLLIAAGAWLTELCAALALPLRVERQVQLWFTPAAHADHFAPEQLPVFACEHAPGRLFYGFPDLGDGVKVGRHHEGDTTDMTHAPRAVDTRDVGALRALLRRWLPDANGAVRAAATCVYTNTPDSHFVVDAHPDYAHVMLVSACSGHGFKFAPVIGEIVADMFIDGRTAHAMRLFQLARLRT